MKRMIIAAVILAACLFGSIYADRRVAADCHTLSVSFGRISKAAENGDKASVKSETDILEKNFETMKETLCVFSDHEWTEEIDVYISTIKKMDDFEEILKACGNSDAVLAHIIEACKPSLPNIF